MFGGGDYVTLGGIDDNYATASSRIDVNIIDAYPSPTDDLQPVSSVNNIRGDLGLTAHYQGIVIPDN